MLPHQSNIFRIESSSCAGGVVLGWPRAADTDWRDTGSDSSVIPSQQRGALPQSRRHRMGTRTVHRSPSSHGHVLRALLPCAPLEQPDGAVAAGVGAVTCSTPSGMAAAAVNVAAQGEVGAGQGEAVRALAMEAGWGRICVGGVDLPRGGCTKRRIDQCNGSVSFRSSTVSSAPYT